MKRVSQQDFFSQENLFLIINVIEDALPSDIDFDSDSADTRTTVFETMQKEYDSNLSITDLNKKIIKRVYPKFMIPPQKNNNQLNKTRFKEQSIRDLDTNKRAMPTNFTERPQITINSNSINNEFERMQQEREPIKKKVTSGIDFRIEQEESNEDIISRFNKYQKDFEITKNVPTSESDAIKQFEKEEEVLTESVQEVMTTRDNNIEKNRKQFDDNLVYQDDVKETKIASLFPIPEEEDENTNNKIDLELSMTDIGNASRLEEDASIQNNQKIAEIDVQTFQKILKDEGEKQFSDYSEIVSNKMAGQNEHSVITPGVEFEEKIHFIEIYSGDRVRSVISKETPYFFTVFFSSNRPVSLIYPHFENNPIEKTFYERKLVYLRGKPKTSFSATLGAIESYEEIAAPGVAGPNIDTVFQNVYIIKINNIQVSSAGSDDVTNYPYLILEIDECNSVYSTTNNSLKKSFCKLYYDRTNNSLNNRHSIFIHLNDENITYLTPKASLERLTFRILNPYGESILPPMDTVLIKNIEIELDGSSNPTFILIYLHNYVKKIDYSDGMRIILRDIEWYNQTTFANYATSIASEITSQTQLETDYQNNIQQSLTTEEKKQLLAQYLKDQIKFSYPISHQGTNSSFTDFLHKKSGHLVSSTTSDPASHADYINVIKIEYPQIEDLTTGTLSANQFGLNTADFNTFKGTIFSNAGKDDCLNGIVMNETVQTSISMTIVTRNEKMKVTSFNV